MQENEISLKELILLLFKGWKWIIVTTSLFLVLGILVLATLNTSTYQVNINGSIVKSDNYDTVFGVYPAYTYKTIDLLNLVKSNEYLEIIAEEENSFTITTSLNDTGDFTITLNSNESVILNKVSASIIENFQDYVNYNLQDKVIEYFIETYQISLERNESTIDNNIKLIETLTNKLNSIDRLIAVDVINPEYHIFSSQRASIEFETIRLQNEVGRLTENIKLIETFQTNNYSSYLKMSDHFDGVEATVNFNSSNPVQELRRFNPLTLLPISVILGGMLGVFIVIFLHYWTNN